MDRKQWDLDLKVTPGEAMMIMFLHAILHELRN